MNTIPSSWWRPRLLQPRGHRLHRGRLAVGRHGGELRGEGLLLQAEGPGTQKGRRSQRGPEKEGFWVYGELIGFLG